MKKYFNYCAVSYHNMKEKNYELKFFFTEEEAKKWLEGKEGSGLIKKWKDDLDDLATVRTFEACIISRIEMEIEEHD